MRIGGRRLLMALGAAGLALLVPMALTTTAAMAATAGPGYDPPTETIPPPNTADCSQRLVPPPAIDTSEDVPPGQDYPAPLPVPATPIGGSALASCDFVLPTGAQPIPSDISAHAWLVADLTTGQVLGAKDPHGRYRPASTLKLLTMLVIWQQLPDFSQQVVGTQLDADQEGSKVGVGDGGIYTIRELMLGLMLNSGNDAAFALARTNGGYDKTIADMNAAAAALGALDTRAATVSGLDGPGQQTSVYDLALIMQADLLQPGFVEMIGTPDTVFPGFGQYPAFGIANDNKLLANYPGAIGGKTGFTDDAGNTYVGVAERNGHRLIVTMLGGTQHPRRQWMQAASLLDWGFATEAAGLSAGATLVTPAQLAASAAAASSAATGLDSAAPTSTFNGSVSAASTTTAGSATTSGSGPIAAPAAKRSTTSTASWLVPLVGVVIIAGAVIWWRRRRSLAPEPATTAEPASTPLSPDTAALATDAAAARGAAGSATETSPAADADQAAGAAALDPAGAASTAPVDTAGAASTAAFDTAGAASTAVDTAGAASTAAVDTAGAASTAAVDTAGAASTAVDTAAGSDTGTAPTPVIADGIADSVGVATAAAAGTAATAATADATDPGSADTGLIAATSTVGNGPDSAITAQPAPDSDRVTAAAADVDALRLARPAVEVVQQPD